MVKVELANPVSFRANETLDAMAKRALGMVQTTVPVNSTVQQPANDTVNFESNDKKVEHFKSSLKDKQWEKTYSPETNLVYVKNKKLKDEPVYSITQDGSVYETGTNSKPESLLIQDTEASQIFNKTKNKKPFTIKGAVEGVWKFFSVTGKMTKATIQGLFYGAVTGAAFLGGSWLFASLPKAFTKEGPKLTDVIRHPLKNISKSGKVFAGIAAAAVLAGNIILGRLQSNENTAEIEHKIYSGHRDK